jgi:hypothetical protein
MTQEQKLIIRSIKFAIKDAKKQFSDAKRKNMYSEMATARAYLNGLEVALKMAEFVTSRS